MVFIWLSFWLLPKLCFSEYDLFNHATDDRTGNNTIVIITEPMSMLDNYIDVKHIVGELITTWNHTVQIKYVSPKSFNSKNDISAAVFSVLTCKNTWDMFLTIEVDKILYIAITEPNCPRLPVSQAITIPLTKEGEEISQLLLDLRSDKKIRWETSTIFLDDSTRYELIEGIMKAMSRDLSELEQTYCSTILYRIESKTTDWERRKDVLEIMKTLPKRGKIYNFLIIVKYDLVGVILEVAKSLNMVTSNNQWLFIIADTEPGENITVFSNHLVEGGNIAFVYNSSLHSEKCNRGLQCHVKELFQSMIVAINRSLHEELTLSQKVSEEEWLSIKPSQFDRRDAMLKFVKNQIHDHQECNNCTLWKLMAGEVWGQEFLNMPSGNELLDIGFWNPREGLHLSDEVFPHSVHGFRGRNLPLAAFHFPPWQIITFNETKVVEYNGLVFEIVKELARKLNFTFTLKIPSNNTAGFSIGNKTSDTQFESLGGEHDASALLATWDKIIHLIQKKKVFIGACAFTITEATGNMINFTVPISTESYVFLVSRPKELSRALLFIMPFTSGVSTIISTIQTWLCIVGAIVVIAPILNCVHRLSPFYDYYEIRNKAGLNKMTNCFWYVYGSLLQQGGRNLPIADSGRLVIGTWWLVVLIVVTTYCGNLVAFLTFPKMDSLITNIHELLERKHELTWGIPATSTLHTLIMSSDDPSMSELYKSAQLHDQLSPKVIDNVRNGKHVYIQRKTSLLFLTKREFLATNTCDFSLGSEEFLHEHLGLGVALGSPYLNLINKEITQMHRVGLINKWLKDYLPMKDRCWNALYASEVNNHTVNLDDMQGSFFVLFLGFAVAMIVHGMEYLVKRYTLSQEHRVIHPFVT